MNKMIKKMMAYGIGLSMIIGLTGCGDGAGSTGTASTVSSGKKTVWKYATAGYPGDSLDAYALELERQIEDAFPDVDFQVYGSEQLGDDDARLELLQSGGVEFAQVAAPFIGNVLPEAQVFALAFVFPDDSKLTAKILHEGKAVEKLDQLMIDQGIQPLDWYNEDFSCWSCNKKIEKLEDMKGLKIRVMNSDTDINNVKAMGANPTPLSYSEVYSALQLNQVDGQQNPLMVIYNNKYYEVQDYVTLSNHEVVCDLATCSTSFWNSLSEEDQNKLKDIFASVNEYAIDNQAEQSEKALQGIKDSGTEIVEISDDERARFKEAAQSSYDAFEKNVGDSGKEILDLLQQDVADMSK